MAESSTRPNVIKIGFLNFWPKFVPNNFIFLKFLKDTYKNIKFIIKNKEPDILFYSVFGDVKKLDRFKTSIKIQISREPYIVENDDYLISMYPTNLENGMLKFLSYEFINYGSGKFLCYEKINKLTYNGTDSQKKKFCCFIVSNGRCYTRNMFFKALSNYKHIDSCGKLFKNVKFNLPKNMTKGEYTKFLNGYKFMICFENVSKPYYTTEKIYNAFVGKVIPIYWGDPFIFNVYNQDAIIYLRPDGENIYEVIDEIKQLDKSDDMYMEKLLAPKMNPKYNDYFDNKHLELEDFFDLVLDKCVNEHIDNCTCCQKDNS
jgi:hypothetical protein